jgi:hypothetical protein
MERETRTPEQITQTITAAKDSVWVIENTIEKLTNGSTATQQLKGDIDRNVAHLKIVVADEEIANSGQDISELENGIALGEAKLAENIWPTE